MLAKLSLRNARRQVKDYLIYFITIIIAATLIYAFNALVFSEEINSLSKLLEALPVMITIASIVVVLIIGWLVYYTMRFMMIRRSQELGTYILLGIERNKIANLFFGENLIVGILAMLIGLLSGNILYQGLRAILLRLYEIPYHFSFQISLSATLLTLAYFAAIFAVALFLNYTKIKRSKINELIHFDRYNEQEPVEKSRSRKTLFLVSIISGISGMLLLITYDSFLSLIGAGLLMFFMFSFYISFSSGMPAFFEKRHRKKYNGNTLYVFRSLSSKVGSMGVTMAVISILLTATLIAGGTGLSFNHMFTRNAELETSHNLFIGSSNIDEDFADYKNYIDGNIDVSHEWQYKIYKLDNDRLTQYIDPYRDYFRSFDYDTVMSLTDYNTIRQMLGYSQVSLPDGGYVIHCLDHLLEPFEEYQEPVPIAGENLNKVAVYNETFTQQLWEGNGSGFIVVASDKIVESLPVSHSAYAAMTNGVITMDDYLALNDVRINRYENQQGVGYDAIYSKEIVKEQNASLYAIIVFPLFYAALVLLIVSATILSIQLLSELKNYQRHYKTLSMLGAEKKFLESALRKQFAVYYVLPTFPAVAISTIFTFFLCASFDPGVISNTSQIVFIIGATLTIFFIVFFIYIAVSYLSIKRSVVPEI